MDGTNEWYQVVGKVNGKFKIFKDFIDNRYEAEVLKDYLYALRDIYGTDYKDVMIYKIK